jgi:pyrroline-5-carboxylate reductase
MDKRLTFIGGGNIAQAILKGLLKSGYHPGSILVADPSEAQGQLCEDLGVSWTQDNAEAARDAQVVIFCVKPQLMETVATALHGQLNDALVISVAAGITLQQLETWSGSQNIVRSMPNTPALLGQGMFGLYASDRVTSSDRETTTALLSTVGAVRWFDKESDIDAVTAVSGSGPAYFFYLMEAMIDAAESLGLEREAAHALVTQTALGAAVMAKEGAADPKTLRVQVTSPNGTTHAACEHLKEGGFEALIHGALTAARDRSIQLSTS